MGGFTLIELLLVMAIIVALVGLGVPLVQRMYARNQLKSTTREIQGVLNRTRLEAIKTGKALVFRYRYGSPVYEILPKEIFDRRKKSVEGMGAVATGPEMLEERNEPVVETATDIFQSTLSGDVVFGFKRREKNEDGVSATTIDFSTGNGSPEPTPDYEDPFTENDDSKRKNPEAVFDDGWSPVILFFPNGRTSQAELEIRTSGRYDYREVLFLRGLTGTAGIVEQ